MENPEIWSLLGDLESLGITRTQIILGEGIQYPTKLLDSYQNKVEEYRTKTGEQLSQVNIEEDCIRIKITGGFNVTLTQNEKSLAVSVLLQTGIPNHSQRVEVPHKILTTIERILRRQDPEGNATGTNIAFLVNLRLLELLELRLYKERKTIKYRSLRKIDNEVGILRTTNKVLLNSAYGRMEPDIVFAPYIHVSREVIIRTSEMGSKILNDLISTTESRYSIGDISINTENIISANGK